MSRNDRMDGNISTRELWIDTEGIVSAGYSGEFDITFRFCGTLCIDVV